MHSLTNQQMLMLLSNRIAYAAVKMGKQANRTTLNALTRLENAVAVESSVAVLAAAEKHVQYLGGK